MWISAQQYERINKRLDALEEKVRVPLVPEGHYHSSVGFVMYLLLQHLGLEWHQTPATQELVKKGGPEQPSK